MQVYPIPIDVFDQHIAFIGKTGSGKTYAAKGAVERLLDLGRRVCVIDPTGVWWGLRLAADGKAKGHQVIVCGGEFGDVTIEEAMAKPLAAAVARSDTPVVVDLSEFTDAATQRFMTAFLAQLRHDNTTPLHLVIDEADMFAPQKPMRDQTKMLHQMNHVIRRGRSKGLRAMLITQRPAVIHKDVLTQVNALTVMRMLSPQDRNAIKAWIEYQADAAESKKILSGLASLERGAGWVWAPEQNMLRLVAFPAIKTYDSSGTPKHGGERGKISLGAINIEALRADLEKAGVEIKQNDPAELRKKIVELERKLKLTAGAGQIDAARESALQQAAWRDGFESANKNWRDRLSAPIDNARELMESARNHETFLRSLRENRTASAAPVTPKLLGSEIALKPAANTANPSISAARLLDLNASGKITAPQRKLLGGLAWWEALEVNRPTRIMLAVAVGWSPKSSNLGNVLGACRSEGLIDYPEAGLVTLLDAGRAAAPAPDLSLGFTSRLRQILTRPQIAMFEVLLDNGAMTREELAGRLNWSAASSNLGNVLGSMKSLKIVTYPVRGSADLEPWVREQARP